MNCASVREQLGAHAIGGLDPVEERDLGEHLRSCAACRVEAEAFGQASEALVLALPVARAPASLRQRILSAAIAPAFAHEGGREHSKAPRWLWAAAAAALAIAGLAGWAIALQLQVNDADPAADRAVAARLDAYGELLRLQLDEETRRLDLAGSGDAAEAEALYVWSSGTRTGVLVCQNLPAAPSGNAYQLWVRTANGGEFSAGTFRPDELGEAELVVRRPRNSGPPSGGLSELLVTLEPAGGSSTMTGPVVLQGAISP